MHAALQTLRPEAPPGAAAPPPAAVPRAPRGLGVSLLAALAMTAALLAAWPDRAAQTEADAPGEPAVAAPAAAVPAVATAAVVAPLPTAAASDLIEVPNPAMADTMLPLAEAVAAAATDSVPASPSMPPPAPVKAPVRAKPDIAIHIAAGENATQGTGPEATDARAVAQAVAAIEAAVRAGDFAAADARLDELATALPPRSLTLMRMQAWHAHQSGAQLEAIALYGEILQRVPDDRNAAINLAVLEAAQGDVEGASQRLRALRTSAGESAELAAAMALVGAPRR